MDIKFAKNKDRNNLKEFINKFWKENHILSLSDQILDFQHLNSNTELNFVIAINNNQILAILGFIPIYQYDIALKANNDIWLAIWKTSNEAPPGTGLKLLEFLEKELTPSSIGSIGINSKVKKIYTLLKYKVFDLNQYYIRNEKISNYKLIEFANNNVIKNLKAVEAKLHYITEIEELNKIDFINNYNPTKSINYIINRYLKHPIYKYDILGSYINGLLINIFVCRKIQIKSLDAACYRIVDVFGDYNFSYSVNEAFKKILINNNFEYVDFYNYGIKEKYLFTLGFNKVVNEIIPNYFEPLVKETIKIMCAVKTDETSNYVVFKGDSDQDRPNKI